MNEKKLKIIKRVVKKSPNEAQLTLICNIENMTVTRQCIYKNTFISPDQSTISPMTITQQSTNIQLYNKRWTAIINEEDFFIWLSEFQWLLLHNN